MTNKTTKLKSQNITNVHEPKYLLLTFIRLLK